MSLFNPIDKLTVLNYFLRIYCVLFKRGFLFGLIIFSCINGGISGSNIMPMAKQRSGIEGFQKFRDDFSQQYGSHMYNEQFMVPWNIIEKNLIKRVKDYTNIGLFTAITVAFIELFLEYLFINGDNPKIEHKSPNIDQNRISRLWHNSFNIGAYLIIPLFSTYLIMKYFNYLNRESKIEALKNFLDNYTTEVAQSMPQDIKILLDSLLINYRSDGQVFLEKVAQQTIQKLKKRVHAARRAYFESIAK